MVVKWFPTVNVSMQRETDCIGNVQSGTAGVKRVRGFAAEEGFNRFILPQGEGGNAPCLSPERRLADAEDAGGSRVTVAVDIENINDWANVGIVSSHKNSFPFQASSQKNAEKLLMIC